MAHHHREFQSCLDDAEKLRLYAQSTALHHQTLSTSLAKAESSSEHWEKEAKDGAASIIWTEKERDEAKQEARAAQLDATATGDAKARVEVDLTKALNSLASVEESGRMLKAEIACLKTEFTQVEVEFARVEAERT